MNKDLHWKAILSKIIIDVYTSRNRHYHTMRHIYNMLFTFDDLEQKEKISRDFRSCTVEAFRWAIKLHDIIIYSPQSEQDSAILAERLLSELLHPVLIEEVKSLILATDYNRDENYTFEQKLIRDLDLMILSTEGKTYNNYVELIKQEFIDNYKGTVQEFESARLHWINQMLLKSKIYSTSQFEPVEKYARINLNKEKERYGNKEIL